MSESASTPAAGVPDPLWVQVVTAAGARCECAAARCHPRPSGDGRCSRELPAVLVVAARDASVPEHAAWRLPAAELAAWCTACLDVARRRQRPPAAPVTGSLFGDDVRGGAA